MAAIGKFNRLQIIKKTGKGFLLDGDTFGEIFLSLHDVEDNIIIDDAIDVFLYMDSEDAVAATTRKPYAVVGTFALLKVVSVNQIGAFLDWGLPKDLLVPFREQQREMEEGFEYVVYIYLDARSGRITASSKLDRFLDIGPVSFEDNEKVDLFIVNRSDIGYNAIINESRWGVIYENEVFRELKRGEHVDGYVKKVRPDWKIDLSLHKPGYKKVTDFSTILRETLEAQGGFINVTDSSLPDLIYKTFQVSKKTFKRAVGALYRRRHISIEQNGIKLITKD